MFIDVFPSFFNLFPDGWSKSQSVLSKENLLGIFMPLMHVVWSSTPHPKPWENVKISLSNIKSFYYPFNKKLWGAASRSVRRNPSCLSFVQQSTHVTYGCGWVVLVSNIRKEITYCRSKHLSLVGRRLLVNHVLTSTFWFLVFVWVGSWKAIRHI